MTTWELSEQGQGHVNNGTYNVTTLTDYTLHPIYSLEITNGPGQDMLTYLLILEFRFLPILEKTNLSLEDDETRNQHCYLKRILKHF